MPRKAGRLLLSIRRAIGQRLQQFAFEQCGSWAEFERRFGIPKNTRHQWSNRQRPSLPEAATLYWLARESGLSLDWLLVGTGPMLMRNQVGDPAAVLMSALRAELLASEGLDQADFAEPWNRLMQSEAEEGWVLKAAANAIRPTFEALFWQVKAEERVYAAARSGIRRPLAQGAEAASHSEEFALAMERALEDAIRSVRERWGSVKGQGSA